MYPEGKAYTRNNRPPEQYHICMRHAAYYASPSRRIKRLFQLYVNQPSTFSVPARLVLTEPARSHHTMKREGIYWPGKDAIRKLLNRFLSIRLFGAQAVR